MVGLADGNCFYMSCERLFNPRLIITAIRPERIFLLTHEDNHLIDLLIIVPDSANKPFSHYEAITSTACYAIPEVSFSLHSSSQIIRHLAEAHPFYLFACSPAKEVYTAKEASPLPSQSTKPEEAKATAQQHFQPGFTRAGTFFHTTQTSYETGDLPTALFLLHQSAELSLRSLIQAFTGSDVKEHSLTILAKHIRRLSSSLYALLSPRCRSRQANSSPSSNLLISKVVTAMPFHPTQTMCSISCNGCKH